MELSDLNGQFIWTEDLLWCPSQCYYYFQDITGKRYCIYLRWRYRDPWTAELIECDEEWEFRCDLDWEVLKVSFHADKDYRSLEKEVLGLMSTRFPSLSFPNRVAPAKEF